ncbi:helix-turn-helix transcriptional regulator [Marichromatium bheemlicum]|uniref:Helix-turn-helix transcriptional regulator n=1 Tax=Marichromatium bheemlicum TaxID=365339 RepID=A0ABX1IAP8_9GAMM|nr:AraC family transcriptional regulator [Marichromatium bheemlicum]NKN34612.1 helix-turn-helix transcriptional regulator [Marichromatium bheemlicum]
MPSTPCSAAPPAPAEGAANRFQARRARRTFDCPELSLLIADAAPAVDPEAPVATPHRHPQWLLLVVLDGDQWMEVEGRRVRVERGRLLMLPPARLHRPLPQHGTPTQLVLLVEDDWLAALAGTQGLDPEALRVALLLPIEGHEVLAVAERLAREHLGRLPGREAMLRLLAEQLARLCLRALAERPASARTARLVEQAVVYVETHLAEPLSRARIAAHLGVSCATLDRLLRTRLGCSPRELIYRSRLARARALLAHTECSITEVAAECGFASPSHLASRFRVAEGCSPRRYRARLRPG